jgi:cytochrome P450
MENISLLVKLLSTIVLLIAVRCIYRLTLHPLARFPGPKLAGLSSIYAMIWDLPVSTSYIKNFGKWHDQYGPIIRIMPNQLHIRDMDAYNQVFKSGTKFSKDGSLYEYPFLNGSFFTKLATKEAKPHRDLYMPYFSRGNVQKMEPIIREHLAKFLAGLDEACSAEKAVDLSLGFRCLAADSLMRYCYDKPFGALDYPEFRFPMM